MQGFKVDSEISLMQKALSSSSLQGAQMHALFAFPFSLYIHIHAHTHYKVAGIYELHTWNIKLVTFSSVRACIPPMACFSVGQNVTAAQRYVLTPSMQLYVNHSLIELV